MRTTRFGQGLLGRLAAVLLGLAVVQPAAAAWQKAQTEHFTMHAESGEGELRRRAVQLEKFHQAGLLMLGITDGKARTARRFDVVMLADAKMLNVVSPDLGPGYAGMYRQCADGAIAFSAEKSDTNRSPGRYDEADFAQVVLFHEVAHRLMFEYSSRSYPRWFVEGFAEYMSRTRLEDDRVTFGLAPPRAAAVLAGERILGDELSWEDLLKASARNYSTEGDFYFKSWLLTHYMFSDSTRTQQLHQYMERLANGEEAVAAFESATGLTMEQLRSTLRRYLRTAGAVSMSGKQMRQVDVSVTHLGEAQGEVLMKSAILRTCPSKSHGEALLAELRKLRQQRSSPAAELRLALARAELLFGDAAAAQVELKTVMAEDDGNFEAQHLTGRMLTILASRASGEEREALQNQARTHYFAAYRLNKLDAPNLYRLALALALRGQDASLLNAARGARAMEPTVSEYAFFEAQVDLQAGDRVRAVQALRPLASNPHDAKFAARMRATIAAIEADTSVQDINKMLTQGD
ncbi:MAG TPA: DUF1570 domain-containing protein [Roseateles sp.]